MLTVHDPAIFFSLYVYKSPPDSCLDERTEVLRQIDRFIEKYNLEPYNSSSRRFQRAGDIDLFSIAKSPPRFQILLQAQSEYPKSRTGTYYECFGYVYHDAFIFQIMITKFQDWAGTLLEGWDELMGSLRSCFNGTALKRADRGIIGASC